MSEVNLFVAAIFLCLAAYALFSGLFRRRNQVTSSGTGGGSYGGDAGNAADCGGDGGGCD